MAEMTRRARVVRLVEAARLLADGRTEAGRALRSRLLDTSGLSMAGIELGIERCLETNPSAAELAALLESTPESPTAHVLLSGNVFVAALRAIAIGVASSTRVRVRASRRDPALAQALHALTPELFELLPTLSAEAGDHFWSYGSDETLSDVRRSLPRGVRLHAHGAGMGAVVVEAPLTPADVKAIALDTALFDQRGCLSPRVVCVAGAKAQAHDVARALAIALQALEHELPPGLQSREEAAEARKNRDAAVYAFELFDAGSGWVGLSQELVVPPANRNLHVLWTPEPAGALAPFASNLTCIGTNAAPERAAALRRAFSNARVVALGEMQRPALDGPVDRRHGTLGELLS
jgi:hypothetical protein